MTESEAIKLAEEQKEIFGGSMNELMDVAIKAFEKQIPKKPVLVNRPHAGVKVPVCSSCSTPECYYPLFSKLNYCPNCGQRLDWSEEKCVNI